MAIKSMNKLIHTKTKYVTFIFIFQFFNFVQFVRDS